MCMRMKVEFSLTAAEKTSATDRKNGPSKKGLNEVAKLKPKLSGVIRMSTTLA